MGSEKKRNKFKARALKKIKCCHGASFMMHPPHTHILLACLNGLMILLYPAANHKNAHNYSIKIGWDWQYVTAALKAGGTAR